MDPLAVILAYDDLVDKAKRAAIAAYHGKFTPIDMEMIVPGIPAEEIRSTRVRGVPEQGLIVVILVKDFGDTISKIARVGISPDQLLWWGTDAEDDEFEWN